MTRRIHNFSPGPAALPLEVLTQMQSELLDWKGQGCGVMEISHRGDAFRELTQKIEADLRQLANIPDDYAVLFLPWRRSGSIFDATHESTRRKNQCRLCRYWLLVTTRCE